MSSSIGRLKRSTYLMDIITIAAVEIIKDLPNQEMLAFGSMNKTLMSSTL